MKAPLRLAAVVGFALLMAVCAQVAVPMVPVPMTLQTFAGAAPPRPDQTLTKSRKIGAVSPSFFSS